MFCARPADFLDLVVAERTEVLDALRHRLSAGADQNSYVREALGRVLALAEKQMDTIERATPGSRTPRPSAR